MLIGVAVVVYGKCVAVGLYESNVAIICLQWDLVCDRAYLKDLTQTIFIVGIMFASLICTVLADKFGRKPIFLFSHWAMVVVGVANAFAPNYYVFTVLRFFSGMLTQVRTATSQFLSVFMLINN